jgi:hypothetical protein
MARPRSYGSHSNRARRKEVANKNATKEQIDCMTCNKKHRRGRACV